MKKFIVSVLIVISILICRRLFASTTLSESDVHENKRYTYEKVHDLKAAHTLTQADNDHKLELPLKIVGLILARGGSKGIPKKNLAKVGNLTLLGRSLKSINEFGRFSSVWVSTDDKEIAEEAKRWGAAVHWRSFESATDTAPSIIGVEDFLAHHGDVDVIALIQCTSPFLSPLFLIQAYSMVVNGQYDTVFAATRSHDLRWQQDIDGSLKPLNFNPKRRPRRQDWPGELVENGMFYFAKSEFIRRGLLQGGRCGVVEIPQNHSFEINTHFDLEVAQLHLASHLLI